MRAHRIAYRSGPVRKGVQIRADEEARLDGVPTGPKRKRVRMRARGTIAIAEAAAAATHSSAARDKVRARCSR
jgi:hypothetical protein